MPTMGSNNTDVTTAAEFLDSVHATRALLSDLYTEQKNRPQYSNQLGAKVAEAHQHIGYGFKMADVHTQLAIAKNLDRIASALEQMAPAGVLR